MKTPKTYRLSPRTIKALNELKKIYPDWTETDIIEGAIEAWAETERSIKNENLHADERI